MRDRMMVRAGTVARGDMLDGRMVTGLGRTWRVSSEDACVVGAHPSESPLVQYVYLGEPAAESAKEARRRERAERRQAERDQEAALRAMDPAERERAELEARAKTLQSFTFAPKFRRELAEVEARLAEMAEA